jgi:hypothetical protein
MHFWGKVIETYRRYYDSPIGATLWEQYRENVEAKLVEP